MRKLMSGLVLLLLAGCATTAPQAPQVQRISPEALEKIMPKPVPNISLDELVTFSKTTPPEVLIQKIKDSNSQYDLTPSQAVTLSKQGVDSKVLDFIYARREAALRDSFADEINKRELQKKLDEQKLKQEYQLRAQPYYDPFWDYGYSPYWRRPFYGPGFRYGW